MLRSFREKPGHHQTTPGWLPTRTPGRSMDGKRRSESDLACKERRQGLSREPNLTRKRPTNSAASRPARGEPSPPDATVPAIPARERPTPQPTWTPAAHAPGRAGPGGYSRRPRRDSHSSLWTGCGEGRSFTEAEAGRGSREREKEVASTRPTAL